MTCLRRSQGGADGFGIAHLADQDDFGILAQNRSDGMSKARRIVANLDLLHDGLPIGMLVLDRIFDGDDVGTSPCIEEIDQSSQGGRLAGACRTCDQNQPLFALHHLGQDGGEMQGLWGGHLGGQDTYACGECSALEVDVSPKPS